MAEPAGRGAERLDAFVDAAFAFALTLLVAGAAAPGELLSDRLRAIVAGIPAFAFAFAVIAMFWHEHVTWRRLCGGTRALALLLSLMLVFVVLIFVLSLVPMAAAFTEFALAGETSSVPAGDLPLLFRLYGAGFATMCTLVMLLYVQGRAAAQGTCRTEARGRAIIYGLMAAAGLFSVCLTFVPRVATFAAFAYLFIPLAVGLFAWRYRWTAVD